ncbi:hypothetical protein DesLBE_0647 [Desulfitobacterium sp. LBE]|uniref:hypothetical protein n=1 Tax=Desulfitobacterium sp. LBE TaxID=884086 RepID=UPI00119BFA82|nr:hypothetical protein [Desulfitobacterium sp. LBE]TWH56442.1 hypothetical protein DesLBE_0647 [Desulfitobacterium sp. LBE]
MDCAEQRCFMEFRDDKECWLSWQLSSKINYRYILWDEETDEPYSYCDYGNPDLENNDF